MNLVVFLLIFFTFILNGLWCLEVDNQENNRVNTECIKIENIRLNYELNMAPIFVNLDLNTLIFSNVEFINGMPSTIFSNTHIRLLKFVNCKFQNIASKRQLMPSIVDRLKIDTIEFVTFNNDYFSDAFIDKQILMAANKILFSSSKITNNLNEDLIDPLKQSVRIDKQMNTMPWKIINLKFINNLRHPLPNKYFCKIKYFTHNHLVVPIIKNQDECYKCSCIFAWLSRKYQIKFDFSIYFGHNSELRYCTKYNDENTNNRCKFEEKILYWKEGDVSEIDLNNSYVQLNNTVNDGKQNETEKNYELSSITKKNDLKLLWLLLLLLILIPKIIVITVCCYLKRKNRKNLIKMPKYKQNLKKSLFRNISKLKKNFFFLSLV